MWILDCTEEHLRRTYDLDSFIEAFCKTIIEIGKNYESRILHSHILLENYVGFGAIIHNRHDLGFFKVRGKFSFWTVSLTLLPPPTNVQCDIYLVNYRI